MSPRRELIAVILLSACLIVWLAIVPYSALAKTGPFKDINDIHPNLIRWSCTTYEDKYGTVTDHFCETDTYCYMRRNKIRKCYNGVPPSWRSY